MTIFSDAYLPYPYGPVPSPGTPSPKFVDLFNDQTAAGNKTFTGLLSIGRAAQGGVAETLLTAGISDAANAAFTLRNWAAVNSWFSPELNCSSNNSSLPAGVLTFTTNPGADIGSSPIADFRYAIGSSQAATRPLKTERNGGTIVQQLNAYGNITSTIISRAGVAETLGTWVLSDVSDGHIALENGTSTDSQLIPRVVLRSSANLPSQVRSVATADTGSANVQQFEIRTAADTTVNTRPGWGWVNFGSSIMNLHGGTGLLGFQAPGGGLAYLNATNPRALNVTLVAGTVTVSNPTVTAKTIIHHARKTAGGTIGDITYTVNPGVGYTLNSSSALDTSVVSVHMVEGP